MNIDNVNLLITTLEAIKEGDERGFNMNVWDNHDGFESYREEDDNSGNDCGTVACMGGWCNALDKSKRIEYWDTEKTAGEWLGLEWITAHALFYAYGPNGTRYDLAFLTLKETLPVLYHLRDTGNVDWSVTTAAIWKHEGEIL